MTEIVDTLREPLSDWAYAKRRRAERRKFWGDWRTLLGVAVAVAVLVASVVQIVQAYTHG